MTVKKSECVRFRMLWSGNQAPFGKQKCLKSLVGLKVREALDALKRPPLLTLRYHHQPMSVNGEKTHRRAARVLESGDVLTVTVF